MLMYVRLAPNLKTQSTPRPGAGLYLIALAREIAEHCPSVTVTVRYGRDKHEELDVSRGRDDDMELF